MAATDEVVILQRYRDHGAHALSVAPAGASQVETGNLLYFGWSALAGADAGTATLYDGRDTTGQVVDYAYVAGTGGGHAWYGPRGIRLRSGLYVNVADTLSDLVVWVLPLDW